MRLCRRGQVLDASERPEAAQWRERFFNFYDERLMGKAWFTAHDPVTIEMFFRLLAVCHTVIPDGPQEPDEIKYEVRDTRMQRHKWKLSGHQALCPAHRTGSAVALCLISCAAPLRPSPLTKLRWWWRPSASASSSSSAPTPP